MKMQMYEVMIKEIKKFCGLISLAPNPSDYCSGEARGENSVKNTIHVIINKYEMDRRNIYR